MQGHNIVPESSSTRITPRTGTPRGIDSHSPTSSVTCCSEEPGVHRRDRPATDRRRSGAVTRLVRSGWPGRIRRTRSSGSQPRMRASRSVRGPLPSLRGPALGARRDLHLFRSERTRPADRLPPNRLPLVKQERVAGLRLEVRGKPARVSRATTLRVTLPSPAGAGSGAPRGDCRAGRPDRPREAASGS